MNCPQHIHARFLATEVIPVVEELRQRIKQLEAELAARPPAQPAPG